MFLEWENAMIPKKIHYIWVGGKSKSNFSNICINSWYEKLYDYEITEWNESNLNLDKIASKNRFFAECRKRKLWAYMADYLRLLILYEYGGIYMDTDVQVLKSYNSLLNSRFFVGFETGNYIGTGVIASEPKNQIIKEALDFYSDLIWNTELYTIPQIMTRVLETADKKDSSIYPMDYFAPYDYTASFERSVITKDTYAIHWFEGSWSDKKDIGTFLQTKHIYNKVEKTLIILKKNLGYYYRKTKRSFNK